MMIEQIVIGTVLMVQMFGMMVQQSILNHTMLVKVDNWILRFVNMFVQLELIGKKKQQHQIGKMQHPTGNQIVQLESIIVSLEKQIGKTQNQMGSQTVDLERMLMMLEPIGMNQHQIGNQTEHFVNMMVQLEQIDKIQRQIGSQAVQLLSIVSLLEWTDKKQCQTGSQTVHQILRLIDNQRMHQFCTLELRSIVDMIQEWIDIQQLHYFGIQWELQMSKLNLLKDIFGNYQNCLDMVKKGKMVQSKIHNQKTFQIHNLVDEPPQKRQMQ